jgi:membrane fusion protein
MAQGNGLFRREVVEARSQAWLGTISLAQPLRWPVAAAGGLAFAAAVLLLLAFGSYTQRTRVSGELVPEAVGASRLQAELLVPEHAMRTLAPGSRILLRYRAFPFQEFGQHAGRVAALPRDSAAPPSGEGGRFFRVAVDLDSQAIDAGGRRIPLRSGMRVDADLPGQRHRLYEWMLAPSAP